MNQDSSYRDYQDDDEIDLRQLVDLIWAMKGLVISVAAVITAAGIGYATLSAPVYESNALVQVEEGGRRVGGNASGSEFDLASALGVSASKLPAEIEILKSRAVATEVMERLGFGVQAQVKRFPVIGDWLARRYELEAAESLPIGAPVPLRDAFLNAASYGWGGERITVGRLNVPKNLESVPLTVVAGKDGEFELIGIEGWRAKGRINTFVPLVRDNGKSNGGGSNRPNGGSDGGGSSDDYGVFISELYARPGTEFTVTKGVALRIVDGLRGRIEAKESTRGSNILTVSLKDASSDQARLILQTVLDVYVRQNVERRSTEARNILDFLDKQVPRFKSELDKAESELAAQRLRAGIVDLSAEAQRLLSQEVALSSQLQLARLTRQELGMRFQRGYRGFDLIDDRIKQLESEVRYIRDQYASLPSRELNALKLTRDVRVGNEIYITLLNKTQELGVARAGNVSSVRVIDSAIAPIAPVEPKKQLVIGLSALAGVFLGVLAVFLHRALMAGITDPRRLELALGTSILSTVVHSDAQEKIYRSVESGQKTKILALQSPSDLAIEGLRSLRTSLVFALSERQNNRVLITGPVPFMGKTFVSSNLAAVMAELGKRVLLIDGDLRRGRIHDYFGFERQPGLTEILLKGQDSQTVIRRVADKLDVLSTGELPPNPADLLSSQHLRQLLEDLSSRYDLVVIDAAPVLAVTDPVVIAPLCAATLVVVKQQSVRETDLEGVRQKLAQVGVQPIGAVVNDVPKAGRGYYYRYHYHYYYQRYQGYYGAGSAPEKTLRFWSKFKRRFNRLMHR